MRALLFLLLLSVCSSCSNTTPQPIKYGSEDCADCKMTIVDEKFGAELITKKGKVYKFDDLICMVAFMKTEKIIDGDVSQKLVIDYQHKNHFIDVVKATYFVGDAVHSPMQGNAAAFENKADAIQFQNGKAGFVMQWNDVYTKLIK